MDKTSNRKQEYRCSFCGKASEDVDHILKGPAVCICLECADLASKLLNEEAMKKKRLKNKETVDNEVALLPKPREIKEFLDSYVIGQDEAKKCLSVGVYNHYKRVFSQSEDADVKIQKSNILLIGPTGSGKTLLVESLAKSLNVPYTIADVTRLTEADYVGDDVQSILARLYNNANGDIAKAEKGIIYLDEIDKKRKLYGVNNRDISGEGVQHALLKMIEGGVYDISVSNPRESKSMGDKKVQINTKDILFVCGGAFVDLAEIVDSRIKETTTGFKSKLGNKSEDNTNAFKSNLATRDLVDFGMIPEFLGRLPIIAVLNPLKAEDLVSILSDPKDALIKQFKESFKMDNHDLVFEDDALKTIAEYAIAKELGARGLRGILETLLLDLQYEIPDNKDNEDADRTIVITSDFVKSRLNIDDEKKAIKK